MIDFHSSKDISINASPETVFGLVGDLSKHQELHGSGEVKVVRPLTDGPTRLGSMIEADEAITLGGETMEFSAQSVVVGYDPPKTISWTPIAPFAIRRIQWWFHVAPEGQGSRVTHEVEVALGESREMMGGTETYVSGRGADVTRGLEKTLQNLKAAAES